jgi:hypothetical protein
MAEADDLLHGIEATRVPHTITHWGCDRHQVVVVLPAADLCAACEVEAVISLRNDVQLLRGRIEELEAASEEEAAPTPPSRVERLKIAALDLQTRFGNAILHLIG